MPRRLEQRPGVLLPVLRVLTRLPRLIRVAMLPLVATTKELPGMMLMKDSTVPVAGGMVGLRVGLVATAVGFLGGKGRGRTCSWLALSAARTSTTRTLRVPTVCGRLGIRFLGRLLLLAETREGGLLPGVLVEVLGDLL